MKNFYALSLFLISFLSISAQSRLYVNINVETMNNAINSWNGSGDSWRNAIRQLRDALNIANQNPAIKEIWVARGTYYPSSNSDRNESFKILRNDLKIYGSFTVTYGYSYRPTIRIWTEPLYLRNLNANPTILSGDIGQQGNSDDNSYHVVTIAGSSSSPVDASTLLEGCTITGGNANSTGAVLVNGQAIPQSAGGGMYISGQSNPAIANCRFSSNRAGTGGGAVYAGGAAFNYCIFTDNSAGRGGAVYNNGSSNSSGFTDCIFVSNQANSYGGGVYNDGTGGSNPFFTNCVFSSNFATGYAGAICNTGESSPPVINCNFIANSAGTDGGAVGNFGAGSAPLIASSIFYNNTAGNPSPDIYNADGANPAVNYSITQTYMAGNGNGNLPGVDPMFINLQDGDGADNIYGTPDDGWQLQPGSPAINKGNNLFVPAGIKNDVTGSNTRILQGTADIGAYESMNCDVPAILYVDSSVAVSGNGSSWATAVKELRDALTMAHSCQQIEQVWVAKGTYFPVVINRPGPFNSNSSFRILRNQIQIFGGFAGTEASPAERNIAANPTVLSGDAGILNDENDNLGTILTIVPPPFTRIDRLTKVDGFTFTASRGETGGGILMHSSGDGTECSPSVSNCLFTGLNATYGGAIFMEGNGNPYIFNCKFLNNGRASIVDIEGASSPDIVNCHFENNTSVSQGGAITHYGSGTPHITNCSFINNKASDGGGAIHNRGNIVIKNCIFTGNEVYSILPYESQTGGAISSYDGSAVITGCTFSSNYSTAFGGAIILGSTYEPDTTSVISNCTFFNNKADDLKFDDPRDGSGGAIFVEWADARITNCSFIKNTAPGLFGGAIAIFRGHLRTSNCTFIGNTVVRGFGGAFFNGGGNNIITNSIFYNNSASEEGGDINNNVNENATVSVTHSLTQTYGTNGADGNIVGVYPMFADTTNFIGPDGIWGTADDGLKLKKGSPALNKGINDSLTVADSTDITGAPRIQQGIVDMGAYEGAASNIVVTLTAAPVKCNSGTTVIKASATGGKSPYQYRLNGGSYSTTKQFTVPAGTYTIGVKDATGDTTSKVIAITQPTPITVTLAKTDVSCYGQGNGSVTVTAGGGTAPYTYRKSTVTDYQSSNTFTALTARSYTMYVKDANGCIKSASIAVTQPSLLRLTAGAKTDVSCNGADGTANVGISGGKSPYQFNIDGGNYQSAGSFTGLTAGAHTVNAKDANGCTASINITLNQAAAVTATLTAKQILCNGGKATITATGTGGKSPYLYKFTDNATGATLVDYQSNRNLSVTAGSYKVLVKDSKGCEGTSSILTVTQPAPVQVSVQKTEVSCTGQSDGSATVTGTGGTAPYQYKIGSGAYQSSNTFTGLAKGSYRAYVKDVNNCTASYLFSIAKTTNCMVARPVVEDRATGLPEFSLKVFPNPSAAEFRLLINSNNTEITEIRVVDIYGREVYKAKGAANKTYQFGEHFVPGSYIVHVKQGNKTGTLKLVKAK